jgi:single-strand DNA-binding protein
MKSITIAGNVGKDAEVRTTQSGSRVTSFSVAVPHYDGKEKTSIWFDVSMWGKRGESVVQFASKGARICVTGDLSTREYNGKTYLQVNASDFSPMGGGQSSPRGPSSDTAPAPRDLDDSIPD